MRVRLFEDSVRMTGRGLVALAVAGLLWLALAAGTAAQDVARAGNGGVAVATANGGAVVVGNVNSGLNSGNVIVVGNTG